MSPCLMIADALSRSRPHGASHLAAYYLVRWLWRLIGWWTLPVVFSVPFIIAIAQGVISGLRGRRREREAQARMAARRGRP